MPELDRLRQSLRAAGVAPRYIERSLAELEDHYADLRTEGLSADDAMVALGDLELLAVAIGGRAELKSWAWHYPRVARLVYPLACLAVLPVAPLLVGADHAPAVARWLGGVVLGGLVTAAMLLSMQLLITLH